MADLVDVGRSVRLLARLFAPLVVVLGVAFGYTSRHPRPRGHDPDRVLRIASWNLRNYPGEAGESGDHDLDRIVDTIEAIDPDVLALQEIQDEASLAKRLPEYAFHLSEHGGRHEQRLGIAIHRERVHLLEPPHEDLRLSDDGRVRPAFVARLQGSGGPPFVVVVVHLKATPDGAPTRVQQWAVLGEIASGSEPVVVLGDFNATGARDEDPAEERSRARAILEPSAGLELLPVVGQCTAYWQGSRYDGWLEPSWLDMIWIGRWAEGAGSQVTPEGACRRESCRPLRSTPDYPDPDLQWMSDHCPVWVDLPWPSRAL